MSPFVAMRFVQTIVNAWLARPSKLNAAITPGMPGRQGPSAATRRYRYHVSEISFGSIRFDLQNRDVLRF
jgi:hypothetical protein